MKSSTEKPRQTSVEKREARRAAGLEVTSALDLIAMKHQGFDRLEIAALSERIKHCTARENWFIQADSINFETGELYESSGNLWQCGSKLCPNCIAIQSRRNRKKLRDAIAAVPLRKNERHYFVTFTIPNPNLSLTETREIVNHAWSLFRKRKLCVDQFRGGCKSEEFTLSANGYHYHLHCIFISTWFSYQELRRVWTDCVEAAFQKFRRKLEIKTKDGYCIVKTKPVTDVNGIIFEVCKYITKSDSWTKLKPSDLGDVALIHRWNRMFETFGELAPRNVRERNEPQPVVHTTNLTDGSDVASPTYWRDVVRRIGIDAYRIVLLDEVKRTRKLRLEQVIGRAVHDSA